MESASDKGARPRLGEILVHIYATTAEQLALALEEQRQRGGRLGELLLRRGAISDVALAQALSLQSGVPLAGPAELYLAPPAEATRLLPRATAKRLAIFPGEGERLIVADPYDQSAIREAARRLDLDAPALALAPRDGVLAAIERYYPTDDTLVLIAGPDASQTEPLAARLFEEGLSVLLATDGATARTLAREHRPRVAVLDSALPVVDGLGVLLALSTEELEVSTYFSASREEPLVAARALELGAKAILHRPWDLSALVAVVLAELRAQDEPEALRPSLSPHVPAPRPLPSLAPPGAPRRPSEIAEPSPRPFAAPLPRALTPLAATTPLPELTELPAEPRVSLPVSRASGASPPPSRGRDGPARPSLAAKQAFARVALTRVPTIAGEAVPATPPEEEDE